MLSGPYFALQKKEDPNREDIAIKRADGVPVEFP
jgi:hypothetical protein